MPDPQERHYNVNKLNRLFALAALVLLMGVGALLLKDYDRKWKEHQNDFRGLEVETTRVKEDAEINALKTKAEYQELQKQIEIAKDAYQKDCGKLDSVKTEINKSKTRSDILTQEFRTKKGELDAARYRYEEAVAKHPSEAASAKKEFVELDKKTTDLKLAVENIDSSISQNTKTIEACGEKLKDLERQARGFTQKLTVLERKLNAIDPNAMSFTTQIANMIRDLPIIDLANPKNKIDQIVLKDITDDVNFMQVPKVDRCTTCHLGIANPDYKNAAQPYKTHPNLELYLGKDSAHPLDEFGCTACHGGRGRGTDFSSAAHTPSDHKQQEEWEKKYNWHEIHHWENPMLPKGNIEASCFKCHSGEGNLKGAEKLNLGLHLIEKAGCYACHTIAKYEDWHNPGPDLRHISSKLTKDWTYRWIKDPQAFRHNTWMPAFFGQSNNSDPESLARGQQEIHAMVEYLFKESQEFKLEEMPFWGDPKKGEEVVAAVGCFGCHNIQPEKSKEARTIDSLRREHGPNLIGLGTKTGKAWLYHWLKDPNRYHPQTLMPNLRLSDNEAADAAAYLSQDKDGEFSKRPIAPVSDAILNDITVGFLNKTATLAQANAEAAKMSLDDKLYFSGKKLIAQYGCYSCHTINGFERAKPIGTELTEEGSKATNKLDFGFVDIEHSKNAWFRQKLTDPRIFDKGKLRAPDEKLRMPNYYFNDSEVDAITTALLGFVKDKPSKVPPHTPDRLYIEKGEELIRQFNCQGCHTIDGDGGTIRSTVIDWLIKYDNRGEAEAKAMANSFGPPNLLGEGKKVQSEWLFEFLHKPAVIRPWIKTRMPTYNFNVSHLNALVKYFNALDREEFPFSSMPHQNPSAEEIAAGEKLFSNEYFGCAQCHIVGDKMPAGSPESWAPDFLLTKTRLKPEWIIDWIKNPQALMPGTKMPNFFDPNNFDKSGPEDILDSDENRQIKALRDYLMTLTPATLPKTPPAAKPSVQPAPEKTPATPTAPAPTPAADADAGW